jgi:sporulation protein YlmC with PRC-barrel domain
MRLTALTILLGSTALASAALAQTAGQPQPGATLADCDRLVVALEQGAAPNAPVTLEQARAFQRDANQQACGDALRQVQATGPATPAGQPTAAEQGTNITVQQAAPAIRVDQVPPQITVQQAQPQVTVRQAQPEILVRQPAPTVTVDIPQPEIIVRMPRPEVAVAQAQPQVEVRQAPPQVQVVPQEQPQVQVQAAQPQVEVQQAAPAQAVVQAEGDQQQPVVRYERAEPRVVVNQQQGQPQVRVEEMQEQPPQGQQPPPAPEGAATLAPPAGPAPTAAEPAPVDEPAPAAPAVAPAPAQTAAVAPAEPAAGAGAQSWYSALRGQELVEETLYGPNGERIGEIENVVVGPDGRSASAVVGVGGFLGIGERRITIPLDQIRKGPGERLATTMTKEQIGATRAFDEGAYRRLDPSRRLGDLGAPG